MRSSKISLNSKIIKTQISFALYASISGYIMLKPHQYWTYGFRDGYFIVMLKTIKYKGYWILLLTLSKNQYQRVPTHFAWSHHIFPFGPFRFYLSAILRVTIFWQWRKHADAAFKCVHTRHGNRHLLAYRDKRPKIYRDIAISRYYYCEQESWKSSIKLTFVCFRCACTRACKMLALNNSITHS